MHTYIFICSFLARIGTSEVEDEQSGRCGKAVSFDLQHNGVCAKRRLLHDVVGAGSKPERDVVGVCAFAFQEVLGKVKLPKVE